MCGSLSDEGSALKMFISKLQSQLSDALSDANGLRGNVKSLETKVYELMSESQMYRGQVDELQVLLMSLCFSTTCLFVCSSSSLTECSRCCSVRRTSSGVWALMLKLKPIVPSLSSKRNSRLPIAFCLRNRSNFFRSPIAVSNFRDSSRIPALISQNLG